jgi:hypothetical protein
MRCAEVREILPAFMSDGEVSLSVRRHISRCADCKRDLAQYESIVAGLGRLETQTLEPPAGLLYALESIPARADRTAAVFSHVSRNKDAYLRGAAAAAVAAGAVGAVIWRRSRTKLAPA